MEKLIANETELLETRMKLVADNRKLLEGASSREDRRLTGEEKEQYEKRDSAIDALTDQITKVRKQIEEERRFAVKEEERDRELHGTRGRDDAITEETRNLAMAAWASHGAKKDGKSVQTEEMRQAAKKCGLAYPEENTLYVPLRRRAPKNVHELREEMEKRAANPQVTTSGSALGEHYVPEGFVDELEWALLAYGGMRQSRAQILRTASGNDLPWPTTNDASQKGRIMTEAPGSDETVEDIATGSIVLQAWKYSSYLVKVSIELMQDSAFSMADVVARALGERIGRKLNEDLTIGTGTGMPLGVMVGCQTGVTFTAGAITDYPAGSVGEELIDLVHSVDPAYRNGAEWMMNDATVKLTRKLQDTTGQYVWQPGLQNGVPDRILGYPVIVNQDVAVMAASAEHTAFGDFSKYKIRDVMGIELYRLNERFIAEGAIGFIAFSRHDGDIVDGYAAGSHEAIKLAANPAA